MSEVPNTDVPIRDAATVMAVRDGTNGVDVLMVRRTAAAVFAAGAFVFPGGRIDDDDAKAAERGLITGRSPETAASVVGCEKDGRRFWAAAARETFEESGILIAEGEQPYDRIRDVPAVRKAVASGDHSFADLLHELDASIDAAAIALVARWVTPQGEKRRFDTRFFVVKAPDGQVPVHDESETTEALWISPQEALERNIAGDLFLLPPTMANLQWLSAFSSADETVTEGLRCAVEPVRPKVVFGDDGSVSLDLGYDKLLIKPADS